MRLLLVLTDQFLAARPSTVACALVDGKSDSMNNPTINILLYIIKILLCIIKVSFIDTWLTSEKGVFGDGLKTCET